MRTIAIALLGLLSAALPAAGAAQGGKPAVTARLSSGVVHLGARFSVFVEVTGTDQARLVTIPPVDGLEFEGYRGPNIQQSTTIFGSRRSQSIQLSWELVFRGTQEGEFTIPPIELEVEGQPARTRELSVRVVEDLRGEELGYLEYVERPDHVYEGEPFAIELWFGWDLGVDPRVNSANLVLPWWDALPGLLEVDSSAPLGVRRIEVNLNSRGRLRVDDLGRKPVRGADFHVYRLRRTFVATRSGKLEFPVSYLEFGRVDFGFLRDRKEVYYVHAEPFTIEVRPLPEEGRPFDFSGGVGRFQVEAHADRRDVEVGESIKLTVEWSGMANLEFFEPPDPSRLEAFSGFRVYGATDRFDGERRILVYDLAPKSTEVTEIPPLPLSVFDTEAERYTRIATEPIPIRVRPLPGGSGLPELESEEPELDIRDLHTRPVDPGVLEGPPPAAVGGAFVLVPLAWLGARTAVRRRRGDPSAPVNRRRRRARRVLRRELREARSAGEQLAAFARFLAARTGEPDSAWEGRDPLAWRREVLEREGREPLAEEDARALAETLARLEERAWAGGNEPLPDEELLALADRLIAGGLS